MQQECKNSSCSSVLLLVKTNKTAWKKRLRTSPWKDDKLCSGDMRSLPVCHGWCYHPELPPKPGSPFLICFACIASSPFFLRILVKRSAKQAGRLSVGGCQHVYWQIIRELGKRPPREEGARWPPETCDSGFSSLPRSEGTELPAAGAWRWRRKPLAGASKSGVAAGDVWLSTGS